MRVFAQKGLSRARMSDVAAEMGVAQGSLYNYVESKEALFRLLLDRGMGAAAPTSTAFPLKSPPAGALARRMDEAIEATFGLPLLDAAVRRRRVTAPARELAAIIDELYERTHATRQAADVLERSAREAPELAAVFYGKVRRGLLDRLERLATQRMASGAYRRDDPRIVARIVIETVTTFARHIYGDVAPPDFDLANARATVIAILVAGIVSPSPASTASRGTGPRRRAAR